MHPSSYFVLYAKIQTLSEKRQQGLLRCLSDPHIANLRENHAKDTSFSPEEFSLSKLLEKVHYSWFIPFLQEQDEPRLFFHLFPEKTAKKLSKSLLIPWEKIDVSPPFSQYLRLILEEMVFADQSILPVNYLQKSTLKQLLSFDKKRLVSVIEGLSLFDVAIELRQIVDQKILQDVASTFSPEEKKRIANISKTALKAVFPRTHYKDELSFQQEMHRRGMARLAIALLQEPVDFLWHITRVLDKGRGAFLFNIYQKKTLANHSQDMINCVLDVLQEQSS